MEALVREVVDGMGLMPWSRSRRWGRAVWVCGALLLMGCGQGPAGEAVGRGASKEVRGEARACDRGNRLACTNLAMRFVEGDGVTQDLSRAMQWLSVGCGADAPMACVSLARLRAAGGEREGARAAWRVACGAGFWVGCNELAGHLLDGTPSEVDAAEGHRLLQMTCGRSELDGCRRLANLLLDERVAPTDAAEGRELLRTTCLRGHARACYDWGVLRLAMAGEDEAEVGGALENLREACVDQVAEACLRLVQLIEEDDRVPEDSARVRRLLFMACELGDAGACSRFAEGGRP